MKKIALILFGLLMIVNPKALAQDQAAGGKPDATEEVIASGKKVYEERCFFCHGTEGAGDGPVADYLDPQPRDFTVGIFKFRTTESGELPTDEDLFRTVTQGIPGTAMPEWGPYLAEEERKAVIAYIKTFFPEWQELDPIKNKKVVAAPNNTSQTPESIAKGQKVFREAKCWECHGQEGRGDGKKIWELEDAWGLPIRPFDLTKGWRFKGGSTPEDIFYRFTTGLNGTPMPSFMDALSGEERWHLANYISSLDEGDASEEVVLRSRFVEGVLPLDPNDPAWEDIPYLRIPLAGQVTVAPRWQNPSVDLIVVKSFYNEEEIAFYLEWDDPTENTVHEEDKEIASELTKDTYVKPADLPRGPGVFRDAVALQFPVNILGGPEKPHFIRGDSRHPVNLWTWKADWQKSGKGSSVEEADAKGFDKPLVPQPPEGQKARGQGIWKNGKWKVVVLRSRITDDKKDVQFAEKGEIIPMAFNVWDGSNGEHGLIMSLSSWTYIYLETSTSLMAYPFALFGVLLIGGLEVWFIRKTREEEAEKV